MRSIFLLISTAAFACSGGRGGSGGEPDRPRGSATPDAGVTAQSQGPTETECEAMIAHVVLLGVGETKADPPPTPDERKAVAAQLMPQFMPGCRASSRAGYRCAMDATSLAELERCKSR